MTEIETHRLLLRRWGEGDLDAYARVCADPEVMKYLPATFGREESAEQMAGFVRHWEEWGFGLWAVEERASGGFIGFVGMVYHDDWPEAEHKTEVGWRLSRAHWRRCLATEGALASVVTGSKSSG
jgi:RimJ/RimL family protein N-acetyltransferase